MQLARIITTMHAADGWLSSNDLHNFSSYLPIPNDRDNRSHTRTEKAPVHPVSVSQLGSHAEALPPVDPIVSFQEQESIHEIIRDAECLHNVVNSMI